MFESSGSELPKNIVLTEDGAIRYYWRKRSEAFFMVLFGVLVLWPGYLTLIDFVPESLLCSLPLSWIPGFALLYFGIRLAINYTELRVDGGELLVQHKPIPWRGNRSISTIDIDRFFVLVRRKERRLTCDVLTIAKNGDKIKIVSNINPEIAEAIVREAEQMLGKPHQLDTEKLKTDFKQEELRLEKKMVKNLPSMFISFFSAGLLVVIMNFGANAIGYFFMGLGVAGIPIVIWMRKRHTDRNDSDLS